MKTDDVVLVVVGLLTLLTRILMTVPVVRIVLEILVTRMVCVSEAEQPITVDKALIIVKDTVVVHVPVAMEIYAGRVIRTPAPVPRGLLIVIEKL